jgi:hypothetical protein
MGGAFSANDQTRSTEFPVEDEGRLNIINQMRNVLVENAINFIEGRMRLRPCLGFIIGLLLLLLLLLIF